MDQSRALHVLLVDHQDKTARDLVGLLNTDGCRVSRAATLAEAHELCEDGRFDLLVTASKLPDGPACELLDQNHACKKISGILIEEKDGDACKVSKGFRAHIRAPLTLLILRKAIAQATGV
ncbi:MAG TPA: response regulator [Tepidisphaeraceae bacterium]